MGEKIKDIKEITLGNIKLMVEQNKGTHQEGAYDIHIQNSSFRLNVVEKDFYKIASSILYARENLESYKGRTMKDE